MADEYDRNTGKNDNAAKTLAIIGIVLALLALGWAMKADRHAADAAKQASSSQTTVPVTTNPGSTNQGSNASTTGNANTTGTGTSTGTNTGTTAAH